MEVPTEKKLIIISLDPDDRAQSRSSAKQATEELQAGLSQRIPKQLKHFLQS